MAVIHVGRYFYLAQCLVEHGLLPVDYSSYPACYVNIVIFSPITVYN